MVHRLARKVLFTDVFKLFQECRVELGHLMNILAKWFAYGPVSELHALMEQARESNEMERTVFVYNTMIALHRFSLNPSIQWLLEEMKRCNIHVDATTREHHVFMANQVNEDYNTAYQIVKEMQKRKEYISLHRYEHFNGRALFRGVA